MKALKERLNSLIRKTEPGSRHSLVGQTLGAFGDPAWVTQTQVDRQAQREAIELAKRPAAAALPSPSLLSTMETELTRMTINMDASLKMTLGFKPADAAQLAQLSPEKILETQHALLDKATGLLKAHAHRAKEAMYLKIRNHWGEEGMIGREVAKMRRDLEWIIDEFGDARNVKVTRNSR